jgi:carbon monoxide dehydrogenase subunit G
MKLENSFTVAAPIDHTWETLLDIERVAKCLPGAKIEPGGEEGVYRGAMKIKLGPMTVDYRGTARLQDVDEDTRTASIAVQAREAKGQGTAAAVIRNQLVKITGRLSLFGRGIMEDVASTMMAEFAKRLEAEISSDREGGTAEAETEPAPEPGAPRPAEAADREALDLGNVLASTPVVRYAGLAAVVLLVLMLLAALRGRKRQLAVSLRW